MRSRHFLFLGFVAALFLFSSCRRQQQETPSTPSQPTTSQKLFSLPSNKNKTAKLRLLMPATQSLDKTDKDFSENIEIDTYQSDSEAISKATDEKKEKYDFLFITDRVAGQLIAQKKLGDFPPAQVSSAKIDPEFLHHYFDINNQYTLPYGYTLLGVACRVTEIKIAPRTWADLFSDQLVKEVLFPQDPLLQAALEKKAGHQLPHENAEAVVTADHPPIATIDTVNNTTTNNVASAPQEVPLPLEVDTIAALKKEHGDDKEWKIVLPEDGSLISLYSVAIPADYPLSEKAVSWLNHFFETATLAQFDSENFLAPTEKPTNPALPSTQNDPLIDPPSHYQDRCSFARP